jgi:hypothetical protein
MAEHENRMFVKPTKGRNVLHPRTFRAIDPNGQDVTSERGYFHRLLRTGDVVMTEPPSRKKPAEPKAHKEA